MSVNGLPWHCDGHAWEAHTCPDIPETHGGVLAGGSGSVFINGRRAGRIGDSVSCGGTVSTGSNNVFCGD